MFLVQNRGKFPLIYFAHLRIFHVLVSCFDRNLRLYHISVLAYEQMKLHFSDWNIRFITEQSATATTPNARLSASGPPGKIYFVSKREEASYKRVSL